MNIKQISNLETNIKNNETKISNIEGALKIMKLIIIMLLQILEKIQMIFKKLI